VLDGSGASASASAAASASASASARTVAATVTLIDATDGGQVGRARTDEDGSYALPVPRPGDYLLVCSAPGRRPVAERVRVAAVDLAISRDLWAPAA
jgi:hypothetical protein